MKRGQRTARGEAWTEQGREGRSEKLACLIDFPSFAFRRRRRGPI